MIPAALVVTITVGPAVTELARLGRCSHRWPQAFLAVSVALLGVHLAVTVPNRILFALAFYTACAAVLVLAVLIALWPMLEDLFDKPRRSRR